MSSFFFFFFFLWTFERNIQPDKKHYRTQDQVILHLFHCPFHLFRIEVLRCHLENNFEKLSLSVYTLLYNTLARGTQLFENILVCFSNNRGVNHSFVLIMNVKRKEKKKKWKVNKTRRGSSILVTFIWTRSNSTMIHVYTGKNCTSQPSLNRQRFISLKKKSQSCGNFSFFRFLFFFFQINLRLFQSGRIALRWSWRVIFANCNFYTCYNDAWSTKFHAEVDQ